MTRIDDGTQSAFGSNQDYNFTVARTGQQFFLTDYSPHAGAAGADSVIDRVWSSYLTMPFLFAAEDVSGVKLGDLIGGELGQLKSVSPVQEGGRQLVRLNCERKFPGAERTYPCSVILNPNHHWAIVSYEQHYSWGVVRGRVEYQEGVTDVAFPKRISQDYVETSGRVARTHLTELAMPQPCDAPAAAFTLQAFGLETPHLARDSIGGRSVLKYALINIAILTVLGIVCFRLYRRHKRDRSVP